jgi:hypothetical protein
MFKDPSNPNSKSPTHFRWVICALLFFATAINYIDRQVIGLLKPVVQGSLHLQDLCIERNDVEEDCRSLVAKQW